MGLPDEEFDIQREGPAEKLDDYCEEIIGRLWALLDEPGDHAEIVALLS